MTLTRDRRRLLIVAFAVAVPLEAMGASLLKYVPRIGKPRDFSPWLCFGGDLTALVHAPWLLLSDFMCAKYCTSNVVLSAITIAGGYLDTVVIVVGFTTLFVVWRNLLTGR
jgi:hypothetical protein